MPTNQTNENSIVKLFASGFTIGVNYDTRQCKRWGINRNWFTYHDNVSSQNRL